MSREYPKNQNQSTWNNDVRAPTRGSSHSPRTGYVKGLTQVTSDTPPLASPAIENQPRKYTKADNPLMATPTKRSLVPHFAQGGKVQGGGGGGNPNKAKPAGGNMAGGMPGMGGGAEMGGAPMTGGLGAGIGPGGQMGGAGAGGGMSSGALGGMPPAGLGAPAGGGQMPGGMPGGDKPAGYGGGPPAPGAIQANGSQVSRATKDRPTKGAAPGRQAIPTQRSLAADGGGGGADGFDPGLGDFNGPAMGSFEATDPQTSSDSMHSGWDMSGMNQWQDFGQDMRNQLGTGMGTPTPMTPGIGGAGFTTFDPAMRGGGFSTGGGFGSDASGGFTESGPSTNPGGGWGGESHFAKGGKAVPPRGGARAAGASTRSSDPFNDAFGQMPGGMPETPPGLNLDNPDDGTAGYDPHPSGPRPSNGFRGDPIEAPLNYLDDPNSAFNQAQRPQQPAGGAGQQTIKGPGFSITRPVAPGYSAPSTPRGPAPSGGMGGGDMGHPDYGGFNGGGYGSFNYGTNPNHTGRTFDDNYGGNNPNNTGGGGNSSGGGYGGSGGSAGGGFGGADQESKG